MTATAPRPRSKAAISQDRRPLPTTEPVPSDEAEAVGAVEGGEPVGIPSLTGVLKGISSALAQPGPVTRGAGRLLRDWAMITRGSDEHLPPPGTSASPTRRGR